MVLATSQCGFRGVDVHSPLEQSKPPHPGSHWHVSGDTQRPWTHSSVHRAGRQDRDVSRRERGP